MVGWPVLSRRYSHFSADPDLMLIHIFHLRFTFSCDGAMDGHLKTPSVITTLMNAVCMHILHGTRQHDYTDNLQK